MITYNHAAYIAQAIEGVVNQRTDFPFELIIGEDCSTDNTREIILEYKSKYPELIKLLLPSQNLGMMKNFIQTLEACEGEYIALCDGDDYWYDDTKLQKQADFLDQHEDFAISFHKVQILNEITGATSYSNLDQRLTNTIEDLFIHNFIYTVSCMFRNGLIRHLPNFFYKTGAGDWVLHILNASKGKIGYIDHSMATYRIHGGGTIYNATTSADKLRTALNRDIYTFQSLDHHFDYKYHSLVRKNLSVCYKHLALLEAQANNRKEAIAYTLESLKLDFKLKRALYLLPLVLSPNLRKAYNFVSRVRGKQE